MRCFSRTLPETRLPGGRLIFGMYRAGEERKRLSSIINELFTQGLVEKTVILWAGTEPVTESPVANSEFVVSGGTSWRDEVRRQFERVFRMYDTNGLTMPHEESVMEELGGLSESAYPTSDDVRLVQRVANRFSVDRDIRQRIQNIPQFRRGFHWVGSENDLRMRRAAQAPPWGAEIVLHFKDDDWHTGIPAARVVRVVPYYEARSVDSIPLFAVADFKGLESDVVILLMRGGMLAHKEVLYVGISRARAILYLMTNEMGGRSLPHPFHWDLDMTWR